MRRDEDHLRQMSTSLERFLPSQSGVAGPILQGLNRGVSRRAPIFVFLKTNAGSVVCVCVCWFGLVWPLGGRFWEKNLPAPPSCFSSAWAEKSVFLVISLDCSQSNPPFQTSHLVQLLCCPFCPKGSKISVFFSFFGSLFSPLVHTLGRPWQTITIGQVMIR